MPDLSEILADPTVQRALGQLIRFAADEVGLRAQIGDRMAIAVEEPLKDGAPQPETVAVVASVLAAANG